jgi:hypothetical protein
VKASGDGLELVAPDRNGQGGFSVPWPGRRRAGPSRYEPAHRTSSRFWRWHEFPSVPWRSNDRFLSAF